MFGCLRTARGAVDAVVIDGVVTSILALTYNDDTGALRVKQAFAGDFISVPIALKP
jgi:hypothetical protein